MLDQSARGGRILTAALRLAEKRPWQEIALQDIAAKAGLSLGDIHEEFSSKMAILAAFSRAMDAAVLEKMAAEAPAEENLRDRLFDVIMTRLEVMAPYKPALKRIMSDIECRNVLSETLFRQSLSSQYWMLTAAGIPADGARGAVRRAGLLIVYRSVFLTWLDDDDPGLAKTMAVLDRKLRNGETWLQRADAICDRIMSVLTRRKPFEETPPQKDETPSEPGPETPPESGPETPSVPGPETPPAETGPGPDQPGGQGSGTPPQEQPSAR